MKYLPLDNAGAAHGGYQQQVKEGNIKRIFDLVRSGRCKSRAQLVREMNLSATSVSVLVEELAARRLIDETGPTQTSLPGRRPISLRLNGDAHQMPVFSLQREGVRYTLLNMDCRVLESAFFPLDSAQLTEADRGQSYVRLFVDVLNQHAKRYDPARALVLGVCFPGFYVESEHIFFTQPTLGFSIPEDAMVELRQLVKLPVYMFNRTRSLAYAEKKRLDSANPDDPEMQDMIFVEIGDGIHSAMISKGRFYAGPSNVSGEIGHLSIDYHGRPCPCGNAGCLERYVSLNAILEDARQACLTAGIEPPESFDDLARRYPDEPVLLACVERSAELLAFGLYGLLCATGMRRVVLGGGIEALGEPFLRRVDSALRARAMLIHHLYLSYAQVGPDAESVGIAHHFLDKVYTITS